MNRQRSKFQLLEPIKSGSPGLFFLFLAVSVSIMALGDAVVSQEPAPFKFRINNQTDNEIFLVKLEFAEKDDGSSELRPQSPIRVPIATVQMDTSPGDWWRIVQPAEGYDAVKMDSDQKELVALKVKFNGILSNSKEKFDEERKKLDDINFAVTSAQDQERKLIESYNNFLAELNKLSQDSMNDPSVKKAFEEHERLTRAFEEGRDEWEPFGQKQAELISKINSLAGQLSDGSVPNDEPNISKLNDLKSQFDLLEVKRKAVDDIYKEMNEAGAKLNKLQERVIKTDPGPALEMRGKEIDKAKSNTADLQREQSVIQQTFDAMVKANSNGRQELQSLHDQITQRQIDLDSSRATQLGRGTTIGEFMIPVSEQFLPQALPGNPDPFVELSVKYAEVFNLTKSDMYVYRTKVNPIANMAVGGTSSSASDDEKRASWRYGELADPGSETKVEAGQSKKYACYAFRFWHTSKGNKPEDGNHIWKLGKLKFASGKTLTDTKPIEESQYLMGDFSPWEFDRLQKHTFQTQIQELVVPSFVYVADGINFAENDVVTIGQRLFDPMMKTYFHLGNDGNDFLIGIGPRELGKKLQQGGAVGMIVDQNWLIRGAANPDMPNGELWRLKRGPTGTGVCFQNIRTNWFLGTTTNQKNNLQVSIVEPKQFFKDPNLFTWILEAANTPENEPQSANTFSVRWAGSTTNDPQYLRIFEFWHQKTKQNEFLYKHGRYKFTTTLADKDGLSVEQQNPEDREYNLATTRISLRRQNASSYLTWSIQSQQLALIDEIESLKFKTSANSSFAGTDTSDKFAKGSYNVRKINPIKISAEPGTKGIAVFRRGNKDLENTIYENGNYRAFDDVLISPLPSSTNQTITSINSNSVESNSSSKTTVGLGVEASGVKVGYESSYGTKRNSVDSGKTESANSISATSYYWLSPIKSKVWLTKDFIDDLNNIDVSDSNKLFNSLTSRGFFEKWGTHYSLHSLFGEIQVSEMYLSESELSDGTENFSSQKFSLSGSEGEGSEKAGGDASIQFEKSDGTKKSVGVSAQNKISASVGSHASPVAIRVVLKPIYELMHAEMIDPIENPEYATPEMASKLNQLRKMMPEMLVRYLRPTQESEIKKSRSIGGDPAPRNYKLTLNNAYMYDEKDSDSQSFGKGFVEGLTLGIKQPDPVSVNISCDLVGPDGKTIKSVITNATTTVFAENAKVESNTGTFTIIPKLEVDRFNYQVMEYRFEGHKLSFTINVPDHGITRSNSISLKDIVWTHEERTAYMTAKLTDKDVIYLQIEEQPNPLFLRSLNDVLPMMPPGFGKQQE